MRYLVMAAVLLAGCAAENDFADARQNYKACMQRGGDCAAELHALQVTGAIAAQENATRAAAAGNLTNAGAALMYSQPYYAPAPVYAQPSWPTPYAHMPSGRR
jgi:hypothetical protein